MWHDLRLASADGRAIPALYAASVPAGPRAALLMHGITAEKTETGFYTRLAERLLAQGVSVLSIDLPGHGDSPLPFEQTSVGAMVQDLAAAWAWLRARHAEIVPVCMSFSASVFLLGQAAGLPRPARAALLNPVTDYRANFIESDTPWGRGFAPQLADPAFWSLPSHAVHGSERRLGRQLISDLALLAPQAVSLPVGMQLLILHGDADSVISLASAQRFARERCPLASTRFVVVPGAEHGFHDDPAPVHEAICAFVS
jgi:alpha-beta hydrolase superfamily lysophospholipase